jgi:RNA polymerase sigma-70 factor, ECF subfamily
MFTNGSTCLPSELVERAAAGDEVATTVLLSITYSRLQQHLQRRIPRDIQACIDVDDVVQDTQIQVFRNVSTFRSTGPDSFYRWVATVGLHRLRNIIKAQRALKRGRGRTIGGSSGSAETGSSHSLMDWLRGPDNTPSQHASRLEAEDALSASLGGLPEHYRQAVRLVYLEGRSVEEVARIMGRTERAIHNLCHKAKEQLHLAMGSTSRFFSRP